MDMVVKSVDLHAEYDKQLVIRPCSYKEHTARHWAAEERRKAEEAMSIHWPASSHAPASLESLQAPVSPPTRGQQAALPIVLPAPVQPAAPHHIPAKIRDKAEYINGLPKTSYAGGGSFPSRNTLKNNKDLWSEFTRDKGVLRGSAELREWKGDGRLFDARMWQFLAGEGEFAPREKAAGSARDTPASTR